ncbi:MAG: hypothetical protein NVV57_11480 [Demequina sp.]|nr:hypothetical protein [Demequina sp.]
MAGISDYRPVGVPDGVVELRVHGVSGTPPEALIKQTPTLVAGTAIAGFYRHDPGDRPLNAESPGVREGYAWGGLTSGTRITSALRLLLLPFSLVNVAGWMAPGVRIGDDPAPTHPPLGEEGGPPPMARRVAWHALTSRLLAACLTLLVTAGAVWIATTAVRFAAHRFHWPFEDDGAAQGKLALAGVVFVSAAWVWSARRRAKMPTAGAMSAAASTAMASGAVARAPLESFDVSRLWQITDVTKRLSGIHWALSIATAAILIDYALGSQFDGARWVAVASIAIGLMGLVAFLGAGGWGRTVLRMVRWTALPLAAISVVWLLATEPAATTPAALTDGALRAVAFSAACIWAAVTVLVAAQYAIGPSGGPAVARLHAGAFTVIGFGTAVTGIVGLELITTRWLNGNLTLPVDPILGAMARSIAMVGFVSVSVMLIILLTQLRVLKGPTGVQRFERLRSTVEHARGAIVTSAVVFGVGAAATVILALAAAWMTHADKQMRGPLASLESGASWAKYGWFAVAAVIAAVAIGSFVEGLRARIIAVVVGAFGVLTLAWAAIAGYHAWIAHTEVWNTTWDVATKNASTWFVVLAVAGAFLAPAAAVVAYMGWGSRDQGLRRGVGIIWDLVDFWPRQFHPWAPPPYTDTTIPELSDRIAELVKSSDGTRVVVSAHSQGAIIAVPAITRLQAYGGLTAEQSARVSLLTYGQLLDSHYRWLFPWIFNPTLFAQVDEFLEHRWVNLFRMTDPLGQPVCTLGAGEGARNVRIDENLVMKVGSTTAPKTLNHGDYWYSQPQFPNALFGLALPPNGGRTPQASPRDGSSGTGPTPRRE